MLTPKAWAYLFVSGSPRTSKAVSWVPRLIFLNGAVPFIPITSIMGAAQKNQSEKQSALQEATSIFFGATAPEAAKDMLFSLFKAWICQPENNKLYTEKEIALFLDRLNHFITEAFQFHQINDLTETTRRHLDD